MRDKILFVMRGGETTRFHTLRTIQEDNVAQHSFGVAWFCHLLLDGFADSTLLLAALAHDLAEQVVGDMPAPIKRELGVTMKMAELEDSILKNAGFEFVLTEEQKRIMKLADCFQGMLFCVRERSLGNRGVDMVFSRYRGYVSERLTLRSVEQNVFTTMDGLWKEAQHGEL